MEVEEGIKVESPETENKVLCMRIVDPETENYDQETVANIQKFLEETAKENTKSRDVRKCNPDKKSNKKEKSLEEASKRDFILTLENADNVNSDVKLEIDDWTENLPENYETIQLICGDESKCRIVVIVDDDSEPLENELLEIKTETGEDDQNDDLKEKQPLLEEQGKSFWCVKCKLEFSTLEQLAMHYREKHYNRKKHAATSKVIVKTPISETKLHGLVSPKKMAGKSVDREEKKSRFRCNRCLSSYVTFTELQYHRETAEHSKPVSCLVCNKTFKHKYLLHLHMKNHLHSNNRLYHIYKCILCETECNTFHKFYLHYAEEHSNENTCILCGLCFPYKFGIKNHLKSHRKRAYRCLPCKKWFQSNDELRKHYHSKDHMVAKICKYCNKVFDSPFKMREHIVLRHTRDRPHQCEYCGKTFSLITLLNTHTLKEHLKSGDFNLVCEHCGRACKTKKTLNTHKQIHYKEQIMCYLCTKSFLSTEELMEHISTHEEHESANQVPGCCPKCCLKTGNQMDLFKHMLNEHYLHICHKCGLYFEKRRSLYYHILSHRMSNIQFTTSGVKCMICYKVFKYKSSLRYHMYIHTGEKPFQCSICEKSFRKPYHIKYHMRLHGETPEYNCYVCHLKFESKHELVAHRQVHMNQYACSLCNRQFNTKKSCEKHVMNKHSVVEKDVAEVCKKGNCKPIAPKERKPVDYKCQFCIRVFRSENACNNHMKRYHPQNKVDIEEMDIKEYLDPRRKDCPFCQRYFKSQHAFDNHMTKAHPRMIHGDILDENLNSEEMEHSEGDVDEPYVISSDDEVAHNDIVDGSVATSQYHNIDYQEIRQLHQSIEYTDVEVNDQDEEGDQLVDYQIEESVECDVGDELMDGFELEEGVQYRIVEEDAEGNIIVEEDSEVESYVYEGAVMTEGEVQYTVVEESQ